MFISAVLSFALIKHSLSVNGISKTGKKINFPQLLVTGKNSILLWRCRLGDPVIAGENSFFTKHNYED